MITNKGHFAIRSVTIQCVVLDPRDEFDRELAAKPTGISPTGSLIPEIDPDETSAVVCPPFYFEHPVIHADVEIVVKYKHAWIPWSREQSFRFAIAQNQAREFFWLPRAKSEDRQPGSSTNEFPTKPFF
jgi:hypothetical protein